VPEGAVDGVRNNVKRPNAVTRDPSDRGKGRASEIGRRVAIEVDFARLSEWLWKTGLILDAEPR
jgi:hypothetical protein